MTSSVNMYVLAIGLPEGDAPPTVSQYIFYGLIGLVFMFVAGWMVIALFSDRKRSRFRWANGENGLPISKLSFVMALPFMLFIPAQEIVAVVAMATGREKVLGIPLWWILPCFGLLLLGAALDKFRNR